MMTRAYTELIRIPTFEGRFDYLRLDGNVGHTTFGFDRWINQEFYRSAEWKRIRQLVIIRDNGCDLGHPDRPINGAVLIHHINPMNPDDIIHGKEWILDPEYLISTTQDTHNAIHYGDKSRLRQPYVERRPGDTIPWRR